MYLDKQNLYSEDQAITATAVSTNVIDHSVSEIGPGEPVEILAQVTEDFAGGTSVAVSLQTDDDEAFGTVETLVTTDAVPVASLTAGYQFRLSTLPVGVKTYSRLNYTVVGTPTAGAVTAGLALDRMAP